MASTLAEEINTRLAVLEKSNEQLEDGQKQIVQVLIKLEKVIDQNQRFGQRIEKLEDKQDKITPLVSLIPEIHLSQKQNSTTIAKWGGAIVILSALASFALPKLFG